MDIKLSLSFALRLKSLVDGEVNYSDFSPAEKKLLKKFVDDDVLDFRIIGRSHKKVFCRDRQNLINYIHHKYEVPSLDNYIAFLNATEVSRRDSVIAGSDSKLRRTRVFTGFLINSFEEISCRLNNERFSVSPVKGAYTFITDVEQFFIPHDVTLVIVENHENFREMSRQRHLLPGIKALFVWRFLNSNAIAEWLCGIPNEYIYFGDFDPKGLHIYSSEFKSKVEGTRGRFLLPENIEYLLATYGEKNLYERQSNFLDILSEDVSDELKDLVNLIKRYKKGLAQEILIGNDRIISDKEH